MLRRDPASFRDPDGFIFSCGGALFRRLTPAARERLKASEPFIEAAVAAGLLLPLQFDAHPPEDGLPFDGPFIKPDKIDLITYPHEWSFEQLKDAALTTLDINLLALKHGLTLKDASAFNIQRHQGGTVFIDHTSFEASDGKLPWRPYSQFCRHFLNPLVISAYRDVQPGALFRVNLDGIPQQLANYLLPWRACFVPAVAIHMLLHNRFIRQSAAFEAKDTSAKEVTSSGNQTTLLHHLRKFIDALRPQTAASTWAHYYQHTNYDDATFAKKKELVANWIEGRRLGTIWDIGANDGTFSRVVAPSASQVLSLDLDHNAVNFGYVKNREQRQAGIHALIYDVSNPTPALGFHNAERSTLEQRSQPDAIMALAVIHHLSITNNLPFDQTASYFAGRGRELLIEFVGPSDSQVKRLLAQKNVPYEWYTQELFERSFSQRFGIRFRKQIPRTDRTVYYLERLP